MSNCDSVISLQEGTPYYYTPEFCESGTVTSKTDIWCIGLFNKGVYYTNYVQ